MTQIWSFLRNRYTRKFYEVLKDFGVTAARMIEFKADIKSVDGFKSKNEVDFSNNISFLSLPQNDDLIDKMDLDFSIPFSYLSSEWVIVAKADSEPVGRALVSISENTYVDSLNKNISFDGAYIRRVYVDRNWRKKGIAKRLVNNALKVAEREFGKDSAYALIAADNKPSQSVFKANGFRPIRRHDYVRFFDIEHRSVRDLS